jgi:hypothetical protein
LKKLKEEQASVAFGGPPPEEGECERVRLELDEHIKLGPASRRKGQKLSATQVAYLLYEKVCRRPCGFLNVVCLGERPVCVGGGGGG